MTYYTNFVWSPVVVNLNQEMTLIHKFECNKMELISLQENLFLIVTEMLMSPVLLPYSSLFYVNQ